VLTSKQNRTTFITTIMSEKILVIGGTGMLGKPVANQLKKAGFPVRLFARKISSDLEKEGFEVVKGDLFNTSELEAAMQGCSGVHINLSDSNQHAAVKQIVESARETGIGTLSYITGASTAEENRWFQPTNDKFLAEQEIIRSGIPYLIFRPSWFFESLELMVRRGKAMMIGKLPTPFRWVAAEDYGRMVAAAYQKPDARNHIFYVFGPEPFRMRELLVRHVHAVHPEIKKVTDIPLWMMKLIGILSGRKETREAASLFAYFEKATELGDAAFTNELLGKPEITFERWLETRK